jgi:DNA ligase-1
MAKNFKQLCKVFKKLENTTSRLDMTSIMGDFLKQCNTDEIQMISYLVQGRVAPKFVDSEFNYSEKSLINLLKGYFDEKDKDVNITKIRQETGDIGDTVFEISDKLAKKEKERSIKKVYEILWEIVNTTGTGSVGRGRQ